ncbi:MULTISPECIES: magnesium and cobalt transport protein CorA [unclassified Sinorhizobium]|uniref:magnesium and cobalt transport protein CorA n=1 Tax=unclassified Sinorhizobium TaxID=2613772 RepID=UPI0024C41CE1|nr:MULTISPECIES: magnesium and cobalt transport protein CorA [unclassified Sinorhizobium]MDK1376599.1 magnesium and cobalt transport protein CorA [Sinorhizobium sp. 6-70]MDK1477123.1 magnesium and cobalt transport protein CorA [Sinorhizobium sp. 6-117]MDK1477208.1 magnesium and cobalt transport protein CorA [Sinorhizobium sp. 6-117]
MASEATAVPGHAAGVTKAEAAVPPTRPGVVAAAVYQDGQRLRDIEIEEAGQWRGRENVVIWIGLHEPDKALLRQVQAEFDLHDLAIEDAGKAHQRPKLEIYGDAIFVVARTAHMADDQIAFGETHLFVGRGYIVSVRHGASTSYMAVRQRCESSPAALAHGENYILYSILDFIVDNYMPVVEAIHAEVEELEDKLLRDRLDKADIERLYLLRRNLLRLRNAVVPLVDVCRRHEHLELPGMEAAMQPLFRDVTDHVRRVQEDIDALREVLAFTFEASLMIGQSEQTEISRKLASWAAILAVPTAIAGIYGMNFEQMPELRFRYGYFVVLAIIFAVCITLYRFFRRARWI